MSDLSGAQFTDVVAYDRTDYYLNKKTNEG